MAKVIKSFHGVKEHRDFLVGDVYVGDREKELTEKGYLEAETKTKEAPAKKTTTKPKTTTAK